MAKDTYLTNHTVYLDGEPVPPETEVDLSDKDAGPLLEATPPAIRQPEAPGPPAATVETETVTEPLSATTVAEIEAILPAIDDEERLQAAIETERAGADRTTAISAIEERLAELGAGDGSGEDSDDDDEDAEESETTEDDEG